MEWSPVIGQKLFKLKLNLYLCSIKQQTKNNLNKYWVLIDKNIQFIEQQVNWIKKNNTKAILQYSAAHFAPLTRANV